MTSNAEWLSAPDAATELGVSYATFWRWIRSGTGPTIYRMGRKVYRVRRSDLDEYLEAHRIQPGDLDHLDLK